jgi:hypothetical protein
MMIDGGMDGAGLAQRLVDVATDRRCFRLEALEEAADGLVYVACGLMRGRE